MTGEDGGDRAPWPDDPELQALAARHRAELRAEAEAYEELAARDWLRGRTLADVAGEMVARGDRVAVQCASRSFTGVLTYAAGDLACLRTAAGNVDVNLAAPLVARVIERVTAGGFERRPGPSSFTARLAEHEAAGSRVEVGLRFADEPVVGFILAVGVDHLVVDADGEACYVARKAVDYVTGVMR